MITRWKGAWPGTLASLALVVSLGACGGRSVGDREPSGANEEPAPPAGPSSPLPSGSGAAAPSGSAREAGTPAPLEPSAEAEPPVAAEPSELVELFRVEVAGVRGSFDPFDYEGPAIFHFTPDGARVALSGHSSVAEFDAVSGAELVPPQQNPVALARDAASALELRHDEGKLILADLASGTPRWAVPAPSGLELGTFSSDGRYAVTLGCDGTFYQVQGFAAADGAAEPSVDVGWCDDPRYERRLVRSLVALRDGGALVGGVRTLDDRERTGLLEVAFAPVRVLPRRVFEDRADHVVELLLAPRAAGVALVGSDDQLRFYADTTFERPRFTVVAPLPYFGYYVPPLVAPLAVSADARYLASIHEDRLSIALRRASDGMALASALGPPSNQAYVPTVPILAAFDAGGDRLAVLWLNWLTVYDVR